jgi:hypothetical protein
MALVLFACDEDSANQPGLHPREVRSRDGWSRSGEVPEDVILTLS